MLIICCDLDSSIKKIEDYNREFQYDLKFHGKRDSHAVFSVGNCLITLAGYEAPELKHTELGGEVFRPVKIMLPSGEPFYKMEPDEAMIKAWDALIIQLGSDGWLEYDGNGLN